MIKSATISLLLGMLLTGAAGESGWREGFENGVGDWRLPPSSAISREQAFAGKNSLCLSGEAPLEAFVPLALEAGKRYCVSMRVKTADWRPSGRNFSFQVHWDDSVQGFGDDGDWRLLRYLTGAMPADTSGMGLRLFFDAESAGTVWVDDIVVTPMEKEPLQLAVEPRDAVGSDDSPPWRVTLSEAPAPDELKQWTVSVKLTSPPWQHVLQEAELSADRVTAEFDTTALPPGKYNILYTVLTGDGRPLGQDWSVSVWKKAPIECRPVPHSGIVAVRDLPLSIQLRANAAGKAVVSLTDESGRVAAETVEPLMAGERKNLVLADQVPPGQYRLTATLDGQYPVEQVINVRSEEAVRQAMYLAPDGFFYRLGERYFPLIVYVHTCGEPVAWEGEFDHRNWPLAEKILDDLTGTPFGLLDYGTPTGGLEDTRRFLAECANRNIPVVLALKDLYERHPSNFFRLKQHAYGELSSLQIAEQVLEMVKTDPNVLAYYINDELSSDFFCDMYRMRELCHRIDPGKPVLQVHYLFDCADELAQSYDIWGTEQYPWGAFDSITTMAEWARDSIALLPAGAQYWGCLKILLGERANERQRALAYSSIAEGAKGLLFYSWFDILGYDPEPEARWREFVAIGRELERDLPIFLLDDAREPAVSATGELSIRTFEGDEGRFLLLVNTSDRENEAALTIPATGKAIDRDGNVFATDENGRLQLKLNPLEVKLLSLDGAPFPVGE